MVEGTSRYTDAPSLGSSAAARPSGSEPMLGGVRRRRIDRALFWDLLDADSDRRLEAVERVLDQAAGRFYGAAMAAVLLPGARYYKLGVLWKVPFSYEHKLAAMDSLVRLDAERALGGLVAALREDDPALQQAAIWSMGRLDRPEVEQALIAVLDDERLGLRHAAIRALAEYWRMPTLRRLCVAESTIVAQAVRWLGGCGQGRLAAPLTTVLRDERFRGVSRDVVHSAVLDALSLLKQHLDTQQAELVIRALGGLLDDLRTSQRVAAQAIALLSELGTESATVTVATYQASHGMR